MTCKCLQYPHDWHDHNYGSADGRHSGDSGDEGWLDWIDHKDAADWIIGVDCGS